MRLTLGITVGLVLSYTKSTEATYKGISNDGVFFFFSSMNLSSSIWNAISSLFRLLSGYQAT